MSKKIIPQHNASKLLDTKSYATFLLFNCMTSSMQVKKEERGGLHIEEKLCTKLFYYAYLYEGELNRNYFEQL